MYLQKKNVHTVFLPIFWYNFRYRYRKQITQIHIQTDTDTILLPIASYRVIFAHISGRVWLNEEGFMKMPPQETLKLQREKRY